VNVNICIPLYVTLYITDKYQCLCQRWYNRVLRHTCEPNNAEINKRRNFTIYTLHLILIERLNRGGWVVWNTCSSHGSDEKCTQSFSVENSKGKGPLGWHRSGWKDNIQNLKMYGTMHVDWIHWLKKRVKWQVLERQTRYPHYAFILYISCRERIMNCFLYLEVYWKQI